MAVRLLKFGKKRAFYFHYHKAATKKEGKPMMTVHVGRVCYLTPELVVEVPTILKARKQQPLAVMAGKCEGLYITDTKITIY